MTSRPTPQPPVPVWGGRPSGDAFGDMLRARAEQAGVVGEVDVQAWSYPGGYGVGVEWGGAAAQDCFCEVADWVDGVRILDSGDADVSVEQALGYFDARVQGQDVREAMEAAGVRKKSWLRRRREGRDQR